jgi:hypothetical protein
MLLKIAFVLLIAWLLGVLGLYRIGDLVRALLLVWVDALATGGAHASRRCRRSWKGCRLRPIMTTRSTSVSFRRSRPR